jgi:hypothetical protein
MPKGWQFVTPSVLQGAFALLFIFAYGAQKTSEDHPEVVGPIGQNSDAMAIIGALGTIGMTGWHMLNNKQSQAVVANAAKAPPVDSNGDASWQHTAYVAAAQAGNAGNHDAALALIQNVKDHDAALDQQRAWPPPPQARASAAKAEEGVA